MYFSYAKIKAYAKFSKRFLNGSYNFVFTGKFTLTFTVIIVNISNLMKWTFYE